MKVYLAGPMRGIPNFNFPAFLDAARRLRKCGQEVISPAEHDLQNGSVAYTCRYRDTIGPLADGWTSCPNCRFELAPSFDMHKTMRWDITQLLSQQLQAIVMLPGWEASEGARAEKIVAEGTGLEVRYYKETLNTCSLFLTDDAFDFEPEPTDDDPRSCWIDGYNQAVRDVERGANDGATGFWFSHDDVLVPGDEDAIDAAMDREIDRAFEHIGDEAAYGCSEVNVVNASTGGEKGSKPARFDLIPTGPLTELALHYGKGASKYADRNWERGVDWSLNYAALMRHITLWWAGEDQDPETDTSHLAAVAWHAFALMEYGVTHNELDDRPHMYPEGFDHAIANLKAEFTHA